MTSDELRARLALIDILPEYETVKNVAVYTITDYSKQIHLPNNLLTSPITRQFLYFSEVDRWEMFFGCEAIPQEDIWRMVYETIRLNPNSK